MAQTCADENVAFIEKRAGRMEICMKKILHLIFGRFFVVAMAIILQVLWLCVVLWQLSYKFTYVNLLVRVIAIIVVLVIVNKWTNPANKLSWTFLILLSPIFGLMVYFLFGRSGLTKHTRERMDAVNRQVEALFQRDSAVEKGLEKESRSAYLQSSYIDKWAGFPLYQNTQTKYYSCGEEMFPDMLEALRGAKHFIFLEYFIIEEGYMFNTILDILEEKPVVEEVSGKQNIEFNGASSENVTFAYGDETILDNVSVDIPKNSVIGIAGRSGSGKSTFLKLFMRFWNVDNGSINISGKNINDVNTSNLRDMESFVTQETHLFADSIKNNIKIAKLDATDVEVYEACKKASVHDFIMGLPKGYDTPVGELGGTLSGGEKQRIGLARAFLHNADMMLLDEPTSNLDSLNEAVILKSLHEERNGKTIVLVSHRKSSMRMVDRVYSVENGRMS